MFKDTLMVTGKNEDERQNYVIQPGKHDYVQK